GKVIAECDPAQETAASLARMMVGSAVHDLDRGPRPEAGAVRLELRGLSASADGPFSVAIDNVDLKVRGGEVVAIAGIAGNGQGELFDLVSGERLSAPDAVQIDGQSAGRSGITARRRAGAAFVPEERLGHGAVPGLRLSENIVLTRHSTG